ncbi:MAG: V-type ATPase subunit [Gammaproteobacteria bacterium]|nr:V-type ATPase subunit [Gammaproteobacteria bacterium]
MGEYDYLNARIKGMHSNLLSKEFYDQVLASQGTQPMIDALLNSSYSPYLRDAFERDRSTAGIEWGLRRNLFDTFEKIRKLAPPEPRWLLGIQFRRWDVQNILAIVRGKAAQMPPEDILRCLFPAGELGEIELGELAEEDNIKVVTDALTAWNFPFAFELQQVVRKHSEKTDCANVEVEFMRIFFPWALNALLVNDANQSLLRKHIQEQIDLINLKSALWEVSQREAGGSPDPVSPIADGRITRQVLSRIEKSSSLEMCFEILAGSYFSRAIDRGILAFGEARRLAVMERFLEIEIAEAGCRMFRTDPLGAGVPLGFIWRKYNEFLNLRILLRNKAYDKPAPVTREELFFVEDTGN